VTASVPRVAGLVVGGTVDIVPAEMFERTAALLPPPSRAFIVGKAGHWPHREAEQAVQEQVVSFLDELR